jgi:hypothetical protein
MGSGHWSADVYETAERLRGGKSAFTYSDLGARTVHPDLDPFVLAAMTRTFPPAACCCE